MLVKYEMDLILEQTISNELTYALLKHCIIHNTPPPPLPGALQYFPSFSST